MNSVLIAPAKAFFLGIPMALFSFLLPVVGVTLFVYIIVRRLAPMLRAAPDPRLGHPKERFLRMLKYAVGQYRHPRYLLPGVLHILLFAGFMILSLRSLTLILLGMVDGYTLPGLGGAAGVVYSVLKDVAATFVLVAAGLAMIRRGVFRPERYEVPPQYGNKDHTWEAILVLVLICTLVTCDMIFEGSLDVATFQAGGYAELVVPGTGRWLFGNILAGSPVETLQDWHLGSFFVHNLVFFFFLAFCPWENIFMWSPPFSMYFSWT